MSTVLEMELSGEGALSEQRITHEWHFAWPREYKMLNYVLQAKSNQHRPKTFKNSLLASKKMETCQILRQQIKLISAIFTDTKVIK